MPSTKDLQNLIASALAVSIICIILSSIFGYAEIIGYSSVIFIIIVWGYILFQGTNKLALNSPSSRASRGGRLFTFVLFCSTFAFSFAFVYLVYGIVGAVVISLFFLVVLGTMFRSTKNAGYSIIMPLTFAGVAFASAIFSSFLGPSGLGFAVAGLLSMLIIGIIIFRFRARAWANYTLSILFIGFTVLGVFSLGSFFGPSPYLFLLGGLIVLSVAFAHSNIISGTYDLPSVFRKIKAGSALLFFASIFFIFGIYRLISSLFDSAFTSYAASIVVGLGVLHAFAFLLLATVLFSTLAIIGAKRLLPLAYGVLTIFSAYGIFGLVQTNILGFWSPTELLSTIVWAIVTLLFFYEPTYQLVNNYFAVPFQFSLEFRLKLNKNFIVGRKGTYSLGNKIGTGGAAIIHEARDVLTNREVILKEPKADPNEPDSVQSLQDAMNQLQKESEVLNMLNFPGIVQYIETFQYGGRQFMVEEQINGKTLNEMAEKGLNFNQTDAIRYTLEILYALNYLHMHGTLHRDLSCNNVMITIQGKVKLIDFGLAKKMVRLATTGFRQGGTARRGTPGYCAPEVDQVTSQGVQLSFSYDIYSAGALLYLMLSGDSPPDWFHLNPAIFDSALSGKCDARIAAVVKKAMAIDPQDRFQSAFEMIAAINNYKGRFIVTDYSEAYDINGTQQATLVSDQFYKAIQGKFLKSSKVILYVKKKSMTIGTINLRPAVNQYELLAEKGVSFNIVSKDQVKSGINKYFLGRTALFWIDEGNKTYRNGVFAYIEV